MKASRPWPLGRSVWPLLLPLALTVLTAGVGAVASQEQPPLEVVVHQLDDADYPDVRLVVSVTDDTGRPLTGFTTDNFAVTAGDLELPLKDVRTVLDTGTGVGVVLALDVSGSMEGQPLQRAKEVSRELVQQLSPADTIAVLAFSDDVTITQSFTTEKGTAIAAIDSLVTVGDTALYNAVTQASDLALQAERPRRAVVLLSDGRDTVPQTSVSGEGSIEAARASGVPFFVVGLGADIDTAYLQQLAQSTGARFYHAPSPDSLRELFDTISTLLRTQYVLLVDGGEIPAADGLSLEVTAERDGRLGRGQRALPDDFFRPRVRLSGLPSQAIDALMSLRPEITAPRDVTLVQYFIDGVPVHSAGAAPFALPLDPIDHPAGEHEISVIVVDSRGDRGEAGGTIQIAPVPPRVNILNAEEGTVISGRALLELDVKSQAPLASVDVLVDGESLRAEEGGGFLLDAAAFSAGPHRLLVRAVDEAGGTAETSVTVELRHAAAGGGRGTWLLALLIPASAGVALLAALWYRRRWRRREPPVGADVPPPVPGPQPPQPASAAPSPALASTPAPRARLTLSDGSNGERVYPVAGRPVTIGSDRGCTIVLADAGGRVAPREVRVWLRDDKFMLHRLSRRTSAPSAEQQPVWAVLENGDEIPVGPYRLTFEIVSG